MFWEPGRVGVEWSRIGRMVVSFLFRDRIARLAATRRDCDAERMGVHARLMNTPTYMYVVFVPGMPNISFVHGPLVLLDWLL